MGGDLPVTMAVAPRKDRQTEGEKKRQEDLPLSRRAGTTRGSAKASEELLILWQPWVCFLKPTAWKASHFFLFILPCGGSGLWEHKAAAGVLLGPQEPRPQQVCVAGNLQAMREFLQFPTPPLPENEAQRPCNTLKPPLARVTVQPFPVLADFMST